MKKVMAAALGLTLGTISTAWAQRADRNVDQPIVRSLNWFSYVAAEDIRAACRPGGRSRLRLIYNALWEEQVRAYELFLQPDGTAGLNIGVLADQAPATPDLQTRAAVARGRCARARRPYAWPTARPSGADTWATTE